MNSNIRAVPPVEGAVKQFSIPVPDEKVLDSGSVLSHYHRNNVPSINMMMAFPLGAIDEKENERGLIHLVCGVLDEGTKTKTSLEFSDAVEFLGSSLSIQADYEQVIISLQSMTEKFEETLQLLSEMLQQPRFEEKDFVREKNNLLVRLQQAKDMPEIIADRAYRNVIYRHAGNYSLPIQGTIESLSSIDVSHVRTWYESNMQQCTPDVFSAGDISVDELQLLLGKYNLTSGKTGSERKAILQAESTKSTIFIVDKPDSVQTEINIGHLTNKRTESDYFAKVILNMIFGGQFSSRLNLNLREKHGLTYGVHSSFNYHIHTGDFCIGTSVSSVDTGKAVHEILMESARITEDIQKHEIDFAKASLVNRFTLNFETYGQLVGNSYSRHLYNLPKDYFNTYLTNVSNVQEEDIVAAARKRICKDDYQIILVGNANEIEKSLFENGISLPVEKIQNESLW